MAKDLESKVKATNTQLNQATSKYYTIKSLKKMVFCILASSALIGVLGYNVFAMSKNSYPKHMKAGLEEASKFMQKYDLNHDGLVSAEEYLQVISKK